jgi:hypothetical protein
VRAAFNRVTGAVERLDVDWRSAALSGAIEHIADAARLRGIYPWRGPLQSVTVAVPSA